MDNFTLLATINVILFVNVIFTIIITRQLIDFGAAEWLSASLLVAAGFFLLLLQRFLSPFFTILIANYMVLLGSLLQVSAALILEFKRKVVKRFILPAVSAVYWILFLIFTYVSFNTSIRIIIISIALALFYGYGVFLFLRLRRIDAEDPPDTAELFVLFSIAAVYYLARTFMTISGAGAVKSLFDANLTTTITFAFLLIFNMVYLIGMLNGSLRYKNKIVIKEREKLGSLFGFLNDTAKHLELEDLYTTIGETLKTTIGMDSAAIYLLDESRESYSIAHSFNELDIPLDAVQTLSKGEGISGAAIEQDRVIVADIDSYPNEQVRRVVKAKGVKSLIGIPLKTPDGIIGSITVVFTSTEKLRLFDNDFFYFLGEQIGLVLHNAYLYKKVADMANTDPLTKLFNRRRMLELIEYEVKRFGRTESIFSIAMADLDHFKNVNDTLGHKCGDDLLKAAADIFKSESRASDFICRWGGEEFLFLLIDTKLNDAVTVVDRMRKKLELHSCECASGLSTTVSIGVAEFGRGMSADEIITRADNALYTAKRRGRNRIETI